MLALKINIEISGYKRQYIANCEQITQKKLLFFKTQKKRSNNKRIYIVQKSYPDALRDTDIKGQGRRAGESAEPG